MSITLFTSGLCRKLNDSYLQSLGVKMLPGYEDPYHKRWVLTVKSQCEDTTKCITYIFNILYSIQGYSIDCHHILYPIQGYSIDCHHMLYLIQGCSIDCYLKLFTS